MNNQQDFLKQFGALTEKLAEQSKRVDKSWLGIAKSVEDIGSQVEQGWGAALAKTFRRQDQLIDGFKRWSNALRDPSGAMNDKQQKIEESEKKLAAMLKAAGPQGLTRQGKQAFANEAAKLSAIRNEKNLLNEINEHLLKQLIYVPLIGKLFKETAQWVEIQQEALKDSNTSLSERIRLMGAIANTQRATGASTETLAAATKAAVNYGLDLKDTYGADLTLITKMKEGMGVSVDNSAALVASLKLVGQNADKVANSIATLVTNTALAADEATRLAAQLTIAMATMAPGGDVNEVYKIVGGLEGAAKGLGLSSGSVFKMLEGLTTTAGFAGAGMINMQPDEILSSQENATKAFTRTAKVFEETLRGKTGGSRSQALDMLGDLFPGSTRDSIAAASKVLAKYNEEKGKATTLDAKWREQTDSFSKAWDKMKNQLGAIIHSVLMPIVGWAQTGVEALSWLIEKISKLEWAAWGAGLAIGGMGIHSIYKLFKALERSPTIINAFYKFFPALRAAAGWLGALTPKLAGLGAAGGAMASLIGVLGIGAAGAAGYGIGRLIGRMTGLDNTMQRLFGGGVQSNIGTYIPKAAPKGQIEGQEWLDYANYMRDIGKDEREVAKWSLENIKNIRRKGTPADQEIWTPRAQQGMVRQWNEAGVARQQMRAVQSTTWTADKAAGPIEQQLAYLKEMNDNMVLQTEFARQNKLDVLRAANEERERAEAERTEQSFARGKIADQKTSFQDRNFHGSFMFR